MTPIERSLLPIIQRWTYCDHAAVGPLPQATRDAVVAVLDAQMREGTQGILDVEARKEAVRTRVATAIGAAPEEIAFMRSSSDGALLVANGLDWRSGDEIILSGDEFGANAYPWLNLHGRGVRARLVRAPAQRLTVETLERLRTPRTRLVAVSYVGFSDGYRHDVAAIGRWCRDTDILFAIDAMQGFGPLPFDVARANADFCYFGTAKWLLSPQGLSVIYVKREHIERLGAAALSWRSVREPMRFLDYAQELDPTATRFEGSTIAHSVLAGFGASLGILADAGFERIERHVLSLTDRLIAGAQRAGLEVHSSLEPSTRSAIVLLALPHPSVEECKARASAARIAVTIRENGVRVSPHGYNTPEEIDRVLEFMGA